MDTAIVCKALNAAQKDVFSEANLKNYVLKNSNVSLPRTRALILLEMMTGFDEREPLPSNVTTAEAFVAWIQDVNTERGSRCANIVPSEAYDASQGVFGVTDIKKGSVRAYRRFLWFN